MLATHHITPKKRSQESPIDDVASCMAIPFPLTSLSRAATTTGQGYSNINLCYYRLKNMLLVLLVTFFFQLAMLL